MRALAECRPAEVGSAVMEMLGDNALHKACRSFASGLPRFGELAHAAELTEYVV